MNKLITVYIEIEKHSNIKYEFDKEQKKLVVDRILDYPYFYPYAYGFIPETLAEDNDEMDILIITNEKILIDSYHKVYIIGALVMEDEKGMDEKLLCVFEEDYENIKDISDLSDDIKNNIHWFFSNYKNKSKGKWSKVCGFINKDLAENLYQKSINLYKDVNSESEIFELNNSTKEYVKENLIESNLKNDYTPLVKNTKKNSEVKIFDKNYSTINNIEESLSELAVQ
jgi:inorganic pyrophosphatase